MFAHRALLLMGLVSLSFGTHFHEQGDFVKCKDEALSAYNPGPLTFQLINWPIIKDEILIMQRSLTLVAIYTIDRSYVCSYNTETAAIGIFTEMVKRTWPHTGNAITDPFESDHVAMSWLALDKMDQITCSYYPDQIAQSSLQMSFKDPKIVLKQAGLQFGRNDTSCVAFLQKMVDAIAKRKGKELEKGKNALIDFSSDRSDYHQTPLQMNPEPIGY